jgi:hypothetical protein
MRGCGIARMDYAKGGALHLALHTE